MEHDLSSNHHNELPQQSNNVITLVLTADNHLGYSALSQQPRKSEELQQRLRRAFQQATDFAIGQGVDLFIQAGDLFDTTNPSEQERSFVAARLAQLRQAGIRAFAVGGTHDTPSDITASAQSAETRTEPAAASQHVLAPQESYARLGALHYFAPNVSELEPAMVDIRGVRVGLCGLGAQSDSLSLARISNDIERADIPILILHAPIEGLSSLRTYFDRRAQVSRASIEDQSSFKVILAGYEHRYHHLRLGKCEVIVAGATQQIDFRGANSAPARPEQEVQVEADTAASEDAPGFVFVGLAADGLRWCRHIPVDTLSLRQLTIQIGDLWSADSGALAPTDLIIERLRPLCSEDALVRLRLDGALTRDQYHQLNLNQIRRYGEEHCFALTIDDSGLALLSEDTPAGNIERLSAREELITLADEWISAATDEQEQNALRATKEELLAAMDSR